MLPSRASETIASGLPISGLSPKLVFIDANVGPGTLRRPPISAVSIRAMVPLPRRIGPTSISIFCMSSRPDST